MAPAPLALFDLDGTLVDTAPDLLETLNEILIQNGLAAIRPDTITRLIGSGVRVMLERGIAVNGAHRDEAAIARMQADFMRLYATRIAARSAPFAGAETALKTLRKRGWDLAVCTNKPSHLSHRLLDELNLSPYFRLVAGPDTFQVRKPDPAHILKTIAALGADRKTSVMIGDSDADITAARAAQVASVVVTFGYSPVPVSRLGADAVLVHYDQLVPVLNTLVASR